MAGLKGKLSRQGLQLNGQLQPFSGVGDHSILRNRNAPDQHTIESITGLEDALDGKMDSDVVIPEKLSDLQNDVGYLTDYTETDPTVPNWAKQPNKPGYTAAEVGALPDDTVLPSKLSDLVNDVGFLTDYTETDPTVPQWAKAARKPTYTAAEVGALPADTEIPDKLSSLQNDVGFVTNLANDLANYYLKSQTYTKDEVNGLISAIPKFRISVVSQLPTQDISATTIYLLVTGDETQNLYTEYIYVNNSWEKLGTQTVDLSGYATVESLGDYLLKSDIASWAKQSTKPTYTATEVGALPITGGTLTGPLTLSEDPTGNLSPATKQYVDGAVEESIQYIPYGHLDSTSTPTVMTASIPGITELNTGLVIMLKNGVATSAAGVTLNINGLGAKPIYQSMAAAGAVTTTFSVNYTMMFVYDAERVTGGCWLMYYGYNANTTYTNASLGQGYATCTTAEATTAKAATLSSYALTAGGYVSVKFTYAVPAGSTLSVNKKTAKPIYYKGSAITAGIINAGDIAVMLYDGSYYHLLAVDRYSEPQTITETDPTVPSWAKQPNKPSYTASEVGALPSSTVIPSKTSDLTNDSGFLTNFTETDPTVPAWAKAAQKPTYTAAEVGALPITGGTLTGALTLSGAPTANLHPATKKYVDDIVGNVESLLASI